MRGRGPVAISACCAAALLCLAPSPADSLAVLRAPAAAGLTAPLVATAALLAQVLTAWLLLVALLTLGASGPASAARLSRALLRRCAPGAVRSAVAVALGTGLVVGAAAGPAAAAPPSPTAPAAAPPTASSPGAAPARRTPTSLPSSALDWPGLSAATRTPTGPGAERARSTAEPAVVVRPGDTLWGLAARSLPPRASDTDRAAEWPRWWSANRQVIGEDPDLLLPGQRLVAPPAR